MLDQLCEHFGDEGILTIALGLRSHGGLLPTNSVAAVRRWPNADPLAGGSSARLAEVGLILRPMRILVTGASGVLGRATVPLLHW